VVIDAGSSNRHSSKVHAKYVGCTEWRGHIDNYSWESSKGGGRESELCASNGMNRKTNAKKMNAGTCSAAERCLSTLFEAVAFCFCKPYRPKPQKHATLNA
jgi:hypothetical protein